MAEFRSQLNPGAEPHVPFPGAMAMPTPGSGAPPAQNNGFGSAGGASRSPPTGTPSSYGRFMQKRGRANVSPH